MIKLENVSKYYNTNNNVAIGIRKVNLNLSLGEFVVITGASGSGKTTLLNVISGMDKYEEGTMYVNGEDTSYFSETDYEKYRNEYISFIFQNYNLIDSYTVYENIELALVVKGKTKKERHEQVLSIIEKVGLQDRIHYKVTKLSGGEKQRVAIARALASEAPIIACDEITGNLDYLTGLEIINLLKSVSKNKLVLMVTHNPDEAMPYATRLIRMYDGSITSDVKLVDIKTKEDIKLLPVKPLNKKETFKIGMKNLFNTPKKTLLMFFVLLTTALFISLSYSLYAKADLDNDYNYYDYDINRYQGRIVVKKADSKLMTEADLKYLENLDKVKNIIVDDLVLDHIMDIKFDLPGKTEWESRITFNIRSVEDISRSDLTYGNLPRNDKQIVLSLSQKIIDDLTKLINTTYRIEVVPGLFENFEISGIIFNELSRNYVYVTENYMKEVRPLVETYHSYTQINPKNKEDITGIWINYFVYYEDSSLADDEILIENHIFDRFDHPINQEVNTVINLIYKNPYVNVELNDLQAQIRTIPMEIDLFENYYQVGIIRLSSNNYQKLQLGKTYQVSLTIKDNANPNQVVEAINQNGFLSFYAPVQYNEDVFSIITIIFQIFILVVSVVLMFVVYLIASLALKNVMMSKKKDYLIMRSLGVKSSKIKGIVYSEVIALTMMATVFWIVIIVLVKNFTTSRFLVFIRQFNLSDLVVIFIIMAILSLMLAFLFGSRIVKETIVTRFVN